MQDITKLSGRILDLDSHIQPRIENFEEIIGPAGKLLGETFSRLQKSSMQAGNQQDKYTLVGEEAEPTFENVWNVKGGAAPGSTDPVARLKVMEIMGVQRSLIFSDPGAQILATQTEHKMSLDAMQHYNDWVIKFASINPDRLRAVALINTHHIDEMMMETQRVIKKGARAIVIPSFLPPGGFSPAHEKMDPFWALLAETNTTVTLHIGNETSFIKDDQTWSKGIDHLRLRSRDFFSNGEPLSPHMWITMSYAPMNFISTMVLGGVFERHPTLRFGAIELGAQWVGFMVDRMEQTVAVYKKRMGDVLSMSPSEYVQRNVRVTPYRFEPVNKYIKRQGLKEVYCFSTDFPHPEGGREPLKEFARNIEGLEDSYVEDFYINNGELLLPAYS